MYLHVWHSRCDLLGYITNNISFIYFDLAVYVANNHSGKYENSLRILDRPTEKKRDGLLDVDLVYSLPLPPPPRSISCTLTQSPPCM